MYKNQYCIVAKNIDSFLHLCKILRQFNFIHALNCLALVISHSCGGYGQLLLFDQLNMTPIREWGWKSWYSSPWRDIFLWLHWDC